MIVPKYACVFLSKEFHFGPNSSRTSSKSLSWPLASLKLMPTVFKAVSTSLTSVSSSVLLPSLICCIRAIIVFIEVPMFSGASRVTSSMVANIA